jgi:NADH dehydrogenase [ubiquinone] 1 alpha subcomplex assembly factor 5
MSDPGQILVFDRALVRAHRDRAAAGFAAHGALFKEIAARLIERLGDIKQEFRAVLDLGAHTGLLARHFGARGTPLVVAADLSEKMLQTVPRPCVAADEELLPFAPGSFDLIVSNLGLHWVNDLPGALAQIKNALKPGGLFLAALIGGNSLYELRACLMEAELKIADGASPRLSPSVSLQSAAALLQRAGFALPVADEEKIILEYADAFALMRDLRGMGETNANLQRLRHPARRHIFEEAARLYRSRFGAARASIPASFEILFLHGIKG